jgi:hypothetical protein
MSSKTRLTENIDATANNFMFGETVGGTDIGARDFALSWMGAGGLSTTSDLIEPAQW